MCLLFSPLFVDLNKEFVVMKDFEQYDSMIVAYNKPISNNVLPLLSWEFYGEHTAFLSSCKYDIDTLIKVTKRWSFDKDIKRQLVKEKLVVVITNPSLKIIYASQNIKKMNGYTPKEIIGHSPKMFQGKETSLETSKAIREAVDKQMSFEYTILNYKKDKSTYMCSIKGFPVYDKRGKLINYIAFEKAA